LDIFARAITAPNLLRQLTESTHHDPCKKASLLAKNLC
jgi:hypothetical protein